MVALGEAPAPLTKYQARPHSRPVKRSHAPPAAMPSRAPKRPRPSDGALESEKPAPAVRKKDGMKTVGKQAIKAGPPSPSKTLDGSSYRKTMFLSYLDDALAQRYQGNNDRYNELVAQFRSLIPSSSSNSAASTSASTSDAPTTPTTNQLRIWLEALTHVVSKLDSTHAPLVETILAVPWATMDDVFVAAYMHFIGALVSARMEWLRMVLERCVRGFKYRSSYTIGSPAAMPTITRRILYGRLHSLLRMLLQLIPTLSPSLSPLLVHNFPSKREPRFAQICYIDNLLAITEYCPALAEEVLGLIIERALNIDVEIQGEPEDWEDVEEDLATEGETAVLDVKALVDRPTAQDEDLDSSDDDDDEEGELDLEDALDSDDEPNPEDDEEAAKKANGEKRMSEQTIRKILENRSKLDAILKVVFDHLSTIYHGVPTPPPRNDEAETTPTPETPLTPELIENRAMMFRTLLDIFDRQLLKTFKTRNVQFLTFYACSLDPSSSDHFIGVLLGRALYETDAVAVTRVAAAGYIASYISRAKFVDAMTTRKVVTHLCRFLENQMDDFAAGAGGGGQDLPVFYAVAQAVMYIVCFRWKDLLDEADDDEIVLETGRRWMMGLETLKRAVASPFNPLKVCSQPVVNQFAAVAHKTNLLYCYAIIEANRRISSRESYPMPPPPVPNRQQAPAPPLRSYSSSATITATPRQLLVSEEADAFFPFDPFKLPMSSVYIDGIYRDWVADDGSSASGTSSSGDSDSSDDDDDDDSSSMADEDDGKAGASGGLAVPGLNSGDGVHDDEVARSFEAMSLSLSPQHESFGGRRKAENKMGSISASLK